jgi:hypothetical protein
MILTLFVCSYINMAQLRINLLSQKGRKEANTLIHHPWVFLAGTFALAGVAATLDYHPPLIEIMQIFSH